MALPRAIVDSAACDPHLRSTPESSSVNHLSDMPAATPGFVHLHVHSSYSLLEGALPIARLAELAKKDRQPALALTDTDNMFGALEFSEKMAGSASTSATTINAQRR
jgi:cytosine/adenosine deaminase-related metal-dependent hydrolase